MASAASPATKVPLAGRWALVTGASRRLGRVLALRLAQEGARLVLHAHRGEAAARALAAELAARGTPAHVLAADLADPAALARLCEQAWQASGGLDLLVHNAGLFERTPPATPDAEAFDRLMATNARSAWLLGAHLAPRMRARGGGAIVNVACASARKAYASAIPYSASKAAVASITQGLARAFAPEVRVNAVAPGPVLPPEGLAADEHARIAATTLLGRWGTPEDVAEAACFLATQPWLTGLVLPVDGGRP
ncbi:MAG: SDR family NAD(P)-dependent oxidoreductase [Planctomycetia bacterium]